MPKKSAWYVRGDRVAKALRDMVTNDLTDEIRLWIEVIAEAVRDMGRKEREPRFFVDGRLDTVATAIGLDRERVRDVVRREGCPA